MQDIVLGARPGCLPYKTLKYRKGEITIAKSHFMLKRQSHYSRLSTRGKH